MEANNAFIETLTAAMDKKPSKQILFDRPLELPNANMNFITNETSHNDTQYFAFNASGLDGVNGMDHTTGDHGFGFHVDDEYDFDSGSELEVPFRIYVDLGPGFPIEDVWYVIDEARRHIVSRIRRSDYRHGPLDMVNGNVLLFEGDLPSTGLAMVDAACEIEYVHRSLENWLLILLDMEVQGRQIEIPFSAGHWNMARCRR